MVWVSAMDNIFQSTMSGLTAGLRVIHIAVLDLKTCDINQDLKEVIADPELSGFDHVPVVSRSRIVGILEPREAGNEGSVKDKMRQLDDSMLVSADESLTSFVPRLKTSPFRLVLKGTKIEGIVTRSGLIKLPVRLVAFTQICHLEMEMTMLVRTRCVDDNDRVTQLDDNRKKLLARRLRRHEKQNLELRVLELVDFGDKAVALVRILGLDSAAAQQLREIEQLRNDIAHAKDYGKTDADLDKFVGRLALTGKWIRRVSRMSGRT